MTNLETKCITLMNIINRYDTFCDENHGHHLLPSSASALDAQEQFLNICLFQTTKHPCERT